MNIELIDAEHTKDEPEFAAAVIARASRFTHRAATIKVYCSARIADDDRNTPQWLEWGINISYEDGGRLFIGAIQRRRGAEIEFHS